MNDPFTVAYRVAAKSIAMDMNFPHQAEDRIAAPSATSGAMEFELLMASAHRYREHSRTAWMMQNIEIQPKNTSFWPMAEIGTQV
jgi:hypothetical protein